MLGMSAVGRSMSRHASSNSVTGAFSRSSQVASPLEGQHRGLQQPNCRRLCAAAAQDLVRLRAAELHSKGKCMRIGKVHVPCNLGCTACHK